MATNGKAKEYTNAVALYDENFQIPGMEQFDRSDMILPRKRLVQPTSQISENQGQIHDSLTNTTKPAINVVIVGVGKGQVMWDKDDLAADGPLCASNDGIMPRPGMAYSGPCASCPMAQWGEDSAPPACSKTYSFLAIEPEEGDVPSLISFSRTSAGAAKQLITLLRKYGMKRLIQIAAAVQKNEKGKYYVFDPRLGDVLTPEQQQHYAALAVQYASVEITPDTEAAPVTDRAAEDEKIPF